MLFPAVGQLPASANQFLTSPWSGWFDVFRAQIGPLTTTTASMGMLWGQGFVQLAAFLSRSLSLRQRHPGRHDRPQRLQRRLLARKRLRRCLVRSAGGWRVFSVVSFIGLLTTPYRQSRRRRRVPYGRHPRIAGVSRGDWRRCPANFAAGASFRRAYPRHPINRRRVFTTMILAAVATAATF